jgi:hypothetical protein
MQTLVNMANDKLLFEHELYTYQQYETDLTQALQTTIQRRDLLIDRLNHLERVASDIHSSLGECVVECQRVFKQSCDSLFTIHQRLHEWHNRSYEIVQSLNNETELPSPPQLQNTNMIPPLRRTNHRSFIVYKRSRSRK